MIKNKLALGYWATGGDVSYKLVWPGYNILNYSFAMMQYIFTG